MFEGEKTLVFWIGLIIVALMAVGIFTILWQELWYYLQYGSRYGSVSTLRFYVPVIVGAVVFMIIGFYMMKSGVKKS